ncbi:uncharacterized protein LOC105912319 [Clupea harengus]|uniref:Uncharacterized protein LOC105912319 n=1 Tax=Clupea harengus TaxID=7950 RepID=A0A6P3WEQ3_CLUHA|nr:uncharacterized protein LOC105912319 [Clupea harengus]
MLESQQLHYHGSISNSAAHTAQDPFEFRPLKVEPDTLCVSQAEELAMLRVRVQQLEREMARLAAENHHLKDLLVKEIPGLLSAMRQTLAPAQPDLHCSLSSSSSSSSSSGPLACSMANADGRYGLMPWPEPGPDPIPSIAELLRNRHEDMDGLDGIDGNIGNGVDLAGSLESVAGRGGEVMKFELSDELEEELGPFLCELGPRRPSVTSCGASPCQLAEMRTRGRPPGCNQLGDHRHMEQDEVSPGSGVFCDARALRRANQSATPTAMVRNLLVGVFDKHTLLNSNLRGGSSKTSPFHNHHAPLDPRKLSAIYDATLARFPSVRRAQIGISINSKLSEIRFYSRRASAERRERVRENDMEGEMEGGMEGGMEGLTSASTPSCS